MEYTTVSDTLAPSNIVYLSILPIIWSSEHPYKLDLRFFSQPVSSVPVFRRLLNFQYPSAIKNQYCSRRQYQSAIKKQYCSRRQYTSAIKNQYYTRRQYQSAIKNQYCSRRQYPSAIKNQYCSRRQYRSAIKKQHC